MTHIPMNTRAIGSIWDEKHKRELLEWARDCDDNNTTLVVTDNQAGIRAPYDYTFDELYGPFRIEKITDARSIVIPRRSFADMTVDEMKAHIYGWCETTNGNLVILNEILEDDPTRIILVIQTDLNAKKDYFRPGGLFSRPDIPRIANRYGRFIVPEPVLQKSETGSI